MCGLCRAGTPQTLGTANWGPVRTNQKTRSRHLLISRIQPTWQLNVLVTPLLKSEQEPAMMAPLYVMLLLRSYVPTTLELSLDTDSDATGSDGRTV